MGSPTIPNLTGAQLFGAGQIRTYIAGGANEITGSSGQVLVNPWRPKQWSKAALTMITIPAAYVQNQNTPNTVTNDTPGANQGGGPDGTPVNNGVIKISVKTLQTPPNAQPSYLIFDGVMSERHSQQATPSRLPIQTQANITDHVLLDNPTLSMEVFMTDVLPARVAGQWVGNPSKSISCFLVLDALRAARVPLTVTTRLKTYTNMILTNVIPQESLKTRYAFKAQVTFEGIRVATISTQTYSARPQTTGSTSLGTTQTSSPSAGVVSQNGVPNAAALQKSNGNVAGAGNWSSNNTNQLSRFLNAPDL
jgi:hypothetical protein